MLWRLKSQRVIIIIIIIIRLIAAAQRRVWQLLAWLNPVVIPGLRAGTCAVLR